MNRYSNIFNYKIVQLILLTIHLCNVICDQQVMYGKLREKIANLLKERKSVDAILDTLGDSYKETRFYDQDLLLWQRRELECAIETDVDPTLIFLLKHGTWDERVAHPDLKEWAFCLLLKYDFITEDGEFRLDVAVANIPENHDKRKILRRIDRCIPKENLLPVDFVWEYLVCYNQRYPTGFSFV